MQIGCRGGLERDKVKAQVGVWFNFGKASLKVRVADRRGKEMRDEPNRAWMTLSADAEVSPTFCKREEPALV
jgi:hypothetical protein